MTPDGTIRSGIVCTRCALRAVALVVPPPTTVPPACVMCKKDRAAVCEGCAGRLMKNVRELTAANIATSTSPRLRAALEMVASVAEVGSQSLSACDICGATYAPIVCVCGKDHRLCPGCVDKDCSPLGDPLPPDWPGPGEEP